MDEDEEDVNKTAASKQQSHKDGLEYITDIREYDVPYVARIAIDFGKRGSGGVATATVIDVGASSHTDINLSDYRVGLWYSVKEANGHIGIERRFDKVLPAEPVVMAFDIETSKAPLKFPDSNVDQIMMISYMVDRQVWLCSGRVQLTPTRL